MTETANISENNNRELHADYLFMVGTHHMPFDRLIQMADRFARENPDVSVLVQYGTSQPPKEANGRENLSHQEMDALAGNLKGVVLPGGPSLMMEWLRRGFVPVIVPRDPDLGEHIDTHQIRFSDFMRERSLIALANDYAQVKVALADPQPVSAAQLEKIDSASAVKAFEKLASSLLAD